MQTTTGLPPSPEELLIRGKQNLETITHRISNVVLSQKHPLSWFVIFGIGFIGAQVLMLSITWLLYKGVGIWGINQPVAWGFDIINFVWWIGIGHAGTLISAVLLLLRQQWRTSINRFAEAMTIFAVMCAGIYPLLHTGRPWVAYWMLPYPNILGMWPQFRSPLLWDVFAVSTYFTVSTLFWLTGLVPDFATLRDRATYKPAKFIFGVVSLGWTNSIKHWFRYEAAYLILAGLSAPLVLSVHTIVSFDFAVSLVPGWHTTVFPPYFVAGAVYAGFAMVLTIALPVRAWYGLKEFITMKHVDWMAKVMLATGLIVFYGYIMEMFMAFYSGNPNEIFLAMNRMTGPYMLTYWSLIMCNGVIPQLLWFPKIRKNLPALWVICNIVSVGMWLERYVIISLSLHRDFLPSSWGMYTPTIWDTGMFAGTIGFFAFLMWLFIRFVPMVAIAEMKLLFSEQNHILHEYAGHGAHGHGHAPSAGTGGATHGGGALAPEPGGGGE